MNVSPNMNEVRSATEHWYLAFTIFREARGESIDCRVAVGCSIMNRVHRPSWWGSTVDEVVTKKWQYCVAPTEVVLLTDLSWKSAGDLVCGDKLIAFDELGLERKFREGVVETVGRLVLPCVRVITTQGSVVVSTNHQWLGRRRQTGRRPPIEWLTSKSLRVGDRIKFLCEPWKEDRSYESGYLAGFFDGEGYVSGSTIGYGQKPGQVQTFVSELLRTKGFNFTERASAGVLQGRLQSKGGQGLKFLGTIRPRRLLSKADSCWLAQGHVRRPGTPHGEVLRVEPVGKREVVAVQTSTRTMIVNGFFSHNSSLTDPNDPQLARVWPKSTSPGWPECFEIARLILLDQVLNPVPGADSYFDVSIPTPAWTTAARFIGQVGKIRFYDVDHDFEVDH